MVRKCPFCKGNDWGSWVGIDDQTCLVGLLLDIRGQDTSVHEKRNSWSWELLFLLRRMHFGDYYLEDEAEVSGSSVLVLVVDGGVDIDFFEADKAGEVTGRLQDRQTQGQSQLLSCGILVSQSFCRKRGNNRDHAMLYFIPVLQEHCAA